MKRLIILVGILLLLAHIQLEFSTWYYRLFGTKQIFPLIDFNAAPEWYRQKGISIEWWIKLVTDDTFSIITYLVMAIALKPFSQKLYLMSLLFVGYHVFSHFMLWLNYRTSPWMYIVILSDCLISVLILIFVKDKKQAIVKSLI